MRFSILSTAIAMASVGQAYLDFVAVPKVIGAKQDYNVTIQTSIGQGSRYYYHIAMGVADPSDYDDIHTFGQSGLQIDPRNADLGLTNYTAHLSASKGDDIRIRAAIFGGVGVRTYPEVTILEANVTVGDANSDELVELEQIYYWISYKSA